ncbi:putative ADP-ribosylation factor-binding protein C25H2.16c [Fusarium oxysporum f. sp. albedinis]|nr:putative ADP-ribosylation factor-binding protein C25H2.16c [Fusarium oxysporum f. sp. albedinis]
MLLPLFSILHEQGHSQVSTNLLVTCLVREKHALLVVWTSQCLKKIHDAGRSRDLHDRGCLGFRVISRPLIARVPPSQKALNCTWRPGQNISPVVQLFPYFRYGFPGRLWTECDCAAIHHAAPLLVEDSFFSCFLTVSHQFLPVVLSLFSFCYLVRSRNLPRRTLSG